MSSQTENSSKKSHENLAEQNQVSVYTLDFNEVGNRFEEKNFAPPEKTDADSNKIKKRGAVSRVLFRWRSAIAAAAILIVGVLNFAFQLSFQQEVAEKNPSAETPVVKEPLQKAIPAEQKIPSPTNEAKPEIRPTISEAKKIERAPMRKVEPQAKPRRAAAVTAKTQIRKKPATETAAERLRRAERILTGV